MTVNHGVLGSSPREGANRKVIRNGDFFRLKTLPITSIHRFLWFELSRGFGDFSLVLDGDYTCNFLFVPRMCQELVLINVISTF